MTMSSPFIQFLSTNLSPNAEEAHKIRQFCFARSSELAGIKEKISLAQEALRTLQAQHDELDRVLHDHEGILSPIRQLPPEILQKVFVYCLPQPLLPIPRLARSSFNVEQAPMLLAHVSRQWRRVVHATPELWCTLSIFPQGLKGPATDRQPSLEHSPQAKLFQNREVDAEEHKTYVISLCKSLDFWLGCSGNYPLTIRLDLHDYSQIVAGRQLIRFLAAYSHRWKRIYLTVPPRSLAVFDEFQEPDISLLETFHIQKWSRRGDNSRFPPHFFSLLRYAPRLCQIYLPHLDFETSLIPWRQLTDLHFDASLTPRMDGGDILSVLQDCAELRSLTLGGYIHFPAELQFTEKLTLPTLHHLKIMGVQEAASERLLSNFILPNLDQLEICNPRASRASAIDLLIQCSSTLTSLTVKNVDDMDMFLHLVPNLVELCMEYDHVVENQIFKAFTSSSTGSYLCPKLVKFTIGTCTKGQEHVLSKFLRERCSLVRAEGVARLESLRIVYHETPEFDFHEVTSLYTKDGLDISMLIIKECLHCHM
ncbi:hypothetical protein BDQ12DRAFT_739286 [Crucibulum laeve]|uniref:Uncharacterized protein n=1 Tax=Crucibulum laeve TaxID=68775 RepID=A0A5C3LHM6_9AGAR|nr:hypothetical protein BDQ12DRAFT_739286 [Crucibulum laeve]